MAGWVCFPSGAAVLRPHQRPIAATAPPRVYVQTARGLISHLQGRLSLGLELPLDILHRGHAVREGDIAGRQRLVARQNLLLWPVGETRGPGA